MKTQELIDFCIARRKELDYSQRKLTKLCGFPQSVIARFETHVNEPKLSNLLKILNALNARIEFVNL